jgi:hypothetical protein
VETVEEGGVLMLGSGDGTACGEASTGRSVRQSELASHKVGLSSNSEDMMPNFQQTHTIPLSANFVGSGRQYSFLVRNTVSAFGWLDFPPRKAGTGFWSHAGFDWIGRQKWGGFIRQVRERVGVPAGARGAGRGPYALRRRGA